MRLIKKKVKKPLFKIMKPKLNQKINTALESMNQGNELLLKSGHILCIPEGHDEPGFLFKQENNEVIIKIGSEEAWMSLIDHCRLMSEEDWLILGSSVVLTKVKRSQ